MEAHHEATELLLLPNRVVEVTVAAHPLEVEVAVIEVAAAAVVAEVATAVGHREVQEAVQVLQVVAHGVHRVAADDNQNCTNLHRIILTTNNFCHEK